MTDAELNTLIVSYQTVIDLNTAFAHPTHPDTTAALEAFRAERHRRLLIEGYGR